MAITCRYQRLRRAAAHVTAMFYVIEIGSIALDAVFVDNMLVSDGSAIMRVHGNFAMPKVGDEIMLEAQFRQIWDNSIIQNWVGLNAIQVNGMPISNRTIPLK